MKQEPCHRRTRRCKGGRWSGFGSPPHHRGARLAPRWCVEGAHCPLCREVALHCATPWQAAGASANRIGEPLQRIARDVRLVRQRATVAPHLMEDAGRALLGLGRSRSTTVAERAELDEQPALPGAAELHLPGGANAGLQHHRRFSA